MSSSIRFDENIFKVLKERITINRDIANLQREGRERGLYYISNTNYGQERLTHKKADVRETFYGIIGDTDRYGAMSIELGNMLEELIDDPTIRVGIHRTYLYDVHNVVNNVMLQSILSEGLKNMGDLMSSGVENRGTIDPFKTVSICNNIFDAVAMIKTSYKRPTNCSVLIAFPAEYVNEDGELTGPEESIYTRDDSGTLHIKPEFQLGVITQEDGICNYFPKEEILSHAKRS